jgi:ABC-2 type transport system permease protein
MRGILNIALIHLRLQLGGIGNLVSLFLVPIVLMLVIGTFNSGVSARTQVIDVLPAEGSGEQANKFVSLLKADGAQKVQGRERFIVCELKSPTSQPEGCKFSNLQTSEDLAAYAKKRIDDGVARASITIPASFTADLQAGKSVTIGISTKSDPTAAQEVVQYVQAVNARLGGTVLAARVVTDKAQGDTAFYGKVYTAAESIWDKNPVQVQETYSTLTGTDYGSGYGQSASGIGAMSVLINALALAQVFFLERQRWTLQRLLMMPVTRAQILGGKLLGQYLLGLVTFGIMLGAGALLGVQWGDPLGVIVIVLVFTLAVTAMALAFSTLVRTSAQATGLGILIPLILAPLGGAWWPMDITPQAMQTVGKIISPIAWSQDAFNKMVFYGATLTDILPSVLVLLVFAVVFFAFGLSRFRYE